MMPCIRRVLVLIGLIAFSQRCCLAQSSYKLTVVPPLSGSAYLNVFGVNTAGHVVGQTGGGSLTGTMPTHAVYWSSSTGLIDLGILPGGTGSVADAINDNEEIVGGADDLLI